MKILIDKSFERDAKRLSIQIQQQVKVTIEQLIAAKSLQEVKCTKMEGAKNAFRIRLGSHRIGFYLEDNQVVLSRVLDRKDIYKYFPKK